MSVQIDTIDRTIFEVVRRAVVASGRLPDWRTVTGADIAEKRANYKTAKALITRPIEVFGNGYARSRGKKEGNSMVIDRTTTQKGSLGAYGVKLKTISNNFSGDFGGDFTTLPSWSETVLPQMSLDLNYQIRYFSNNVFDLNLMDNIGFGIFNVNPYLNVLVADSWEESGKFLHVAKGDTLDLTTTDFMEKILQITVKDFWLYDSTVVANYVPLQTVDYGIYNMFVPGQSMVEFNIDLTA